MNDGKKREWKSPTGIPVDSYEEVQFFHWILEAKMIGLVECFKYHPRPFVLADPVTVPEQIRLKTKIVDRRRHLLNDCCYTADFVFRATRLMNEIDHGLFAANGSDFWVDVKGTFGPHNDAAKFSVIRKWVYAKHGIFINKIVPVDFFEKTFAPYRLRYKKNGEVRAAFLNCRTSNELSELVHRQPAFL